MKSKKKIFAVAALSLAVFGTANMVFANTGEKKSLLNRLGLTKSIYDQGSGDKFDNIREQPTFQEEFDSVKSLISEKEKDTLLKLNEDLKKYKKSEEYDKVGDTWTEIYRITTKYNTGGVPSFEDSLGNLKDHLNKDEISKLKDLYSEVEKTKGSEKAWGKFHKAVEEHLKSISPADVYNYPSFDEFITSYKDSISKEDYETVKKLYIEMESQVKELKHEEISKSWDKIYDILGVNE